MVGGEVSDHTRTRTRTLHKFTRLFFCCIVGERASTSPKHILVSLLSCRRDVSRFPHQARGSGCHRPRRRRSWAHRPNESSCLSDMTDPVEWLNDVAICWKAVCVSDEQTASRAAGQWHLLGNTWNAPGRTRRRARPVLTIRVDERVFQSADATFVFLCNRGLREPSQAVDVPRSSQKPGVPADRRAHPSTWWSFSTTSALIHDVSRVYDLEAQSRNALRRTRRSRQPV
jgi:hypothetical protein